MRIEDANPVCTECGVCMICGVKSASRSLVFFICARAAQLMCFGCQGVYPNQAPPEGTREDRWLECHKTKHGFCGFVRGTNRFFRGRYLVSLPKGSRNEASRWFVGLYQVRGVLLFNLTSNDSVGLGQ